MKRFMNLLDKVSLIDVGARSSPLSQAQVKEILSLLRPMYPDLSFNVMTFQTVGDSDKTTSLRHLDKTDFFTKEIDEWVLAGKNRIGIHSAKDLPDPLKEGLSLFALTEGVDSSDALVIRDERTLASLPLGALIATSSIRRESCVRELRQDLTFCDIRGTIGERLATLQSGKVEGVVIAEAALIRLGLTHLNRIRLPGKTAKGQGQLAIVGREVDRMGEIAKLFSVIDCRK